MSDTFTIIYRTQPTSDAPASAPPASSVTWGDVTAKPFTSIGSRLSVSGGSLSADIQTWAQITGKPFVTVGEGLEVVANELQRVTTEAITAHKTGTYTFAAINTWEDLDFDLIETDKTTDKIDVDTDDITFVYNGPDDLLMIGGTVRTSWGGAPGTDVTAYLRVMVKQPGGAFTEDRTCQASEMTSQAGSGLGTFRFGGAVPVTDGTEFKLQARVTDLDLTFSAPGVFDNDVSITLEAHTIGAHIQPTS
jgi:hypothetical protein